MLTNLMKRTSSQLHQFQAHCHFHKMIIAQYSHVCLSPSETSPEFWQMSNMEYLHWGYGVCRYVLSIEYDHGIFALGVCDMHHYHCWDGGQID